MNGKAGKAKPKMADVTKSKKTTATDTDAQSLVIQSRPIIGRATAAATSNPEPVAPKEGEEPATAPILPSQSKRTLIVPVGDGESTDKAASKAAPADEEAAPDEKKKAAAASAKDEAEKTQDDAPDDDAAEPKEEKPTAETQKALEEAAAAEKRQKELESLIDSKEFFVPINAVATKREVKHSALMAVVILVLAFVLVDLMLDTGVILLVQKIPHTHFFTTTSANK